jgi:nucleotide-binding universal stress UspA family protein
MFNKILVCLDGSKLAEQVLPYAIEQALRFKSQLVLLSVIVPATSNSTVWEPAPQELVEKQAEAEKAAEAYLKNIINRLSEEKGLRAEYLTLEGLVAETIVEYAQKNKVDLIAIATHGLGGLRRLAFGSVADFVLRNSNVPLLVIRPNEI